MPKFAVLLPAAGRSSRFSGRDKKPFALLDGRAVWLRSAELFVSRDDVVQTVLILAPGDMDYFRQRYTANIAFMNIKLVPGGDQRYDSVANGLAALDPAVEFVAVHDAVRPCVTADLIEAVFAEAVKHGAALPGVPIADTIKQVADKNRVKATMPRADLWLAQTPQVFRKDWLVEAYNRRAELGPEVTDDAQLVEAAGHIVRVVPGDPGNIKITARGDVFLAEAIMKSRPKPKPTGPQHPFADEDKWR